MFEILHLKKFLHRPVPRIELGLAISKYASSCIDVSDGLSKDLKLICEASHVGADIYLNQIPTSKKIIILMERIGAQNNKWTVIRNKNTIKNSIVKIL